jgi:hypothetical protein
MPTRHGTSRTALGSICACMNRTTREASASPTTRSQGTPRHTRQTLGLSPSWALLLALLKRFGCQATTSMIPPPGAPPPLYTLKHLHAALLQDYDCTEQPAADLPALSGAGGSAAANAGAPPPPLPARSQDTGSGTLVLPQLNRLHEAYKRRQVAPPASSSSQDQQPTASGPIPSQRRLTQQLTAHWPQFKILRQGYAGTRFEEQRQLHMLMKHTATVPDSALRMEMNALEAQADTAKARDLHWKPLSWLGTLRPTTANDARDQPLWETFVCKTLGLEVPVLASLPRRNQRSPALCGCKKHGMDLYGDHTSTCTAHSGATKAHDWAVGVLGPLFRTA